MDLVGDVRDEPKVRSLDDDILARLGSFLRPSAGSSP
jgi:hypothetical protein